MARRFSELTRLTPEAKQKLAETSDDLGVEQGLLLSNLVAWFAAQGGQSKPPCWNAVQVRCRLTLLRLAERNIARNVDVNANPANSAIDQAQAI